LGSFISGGGGVSPRGNRAAGRIACDYIRGWLDYCLQAYARVSKFRPDWFQEPSNNGDSNREIVSDRHVLTACVVGRWTSWFGDLD